jgi:hypothetical protein
LVDGVDGSLGVFGKSPGRVAGGKMEGTKIGEIGGFKSIALAIRIAVRVCFDGC